LTPPEGRRAYDVAPDGRIVCVIVPAGGDESTGSQVLAVVLNWHEELKAKCRRLGADCAERFIRSQQSDLAGRNAFPTSRCWRCAV